MRYLLDSNVWIKVLQARDLRIVDRFTATEPEDMAACSMVRAELMHGAAKYEDPDLRRSNVELLLARFVSLPFDDRCADVYARIRHDLEKRGCVIGPFDLQIAAVALVHDLTLVIGNLDEFKRVHGLEVEDWSLPMV